MTPIKLIGFFQCMVFTVDNADFIEFQCVAMNESKAEWVAQALARAHGVTVRKFDYITPGKYTR